MLRSDQPLRAYPWSSWQEYLRPPGQRPKWLRVDRVLGEAGKLQDSAAGRRELEGAMERRRGAEEDARYQPIRRGWFFGPGRLKKELLGQMSERLGPEHYGEERAESQAGAAERVVKEELRRRRWTEAALAQRTKGDAEKLTMAVRLRKETLVTVAWIAARLQMGSVANVNTLLYQWRRSQHRK